MQNKFHLSTPHAFVIHFICNSFEKFEIKMKLTQMLLLLLLLELLPLVDLLPLELLLLLLYVFNYVLLRGREAPP